MQSLFIAVVKEKIEKGMEEAAAEELEEDINALRGILENLIQLSFDQEALMKELQKTPYQSDGL